MLGAGGAFLFWRNRSREAFAGGPQFDAFVAPEPTPPPRPAPAAGSGRPRPRHRSASSRRACGRGSSSASSPVAASSRTTRSRFEFELALQNSGSAPARAVLVEASLLNAGPYQERGNLELSTATGRRGRAHRGRSRRSRPCVVNTQVVAPARQRAADRDRRTPGVRSVDRLQRALQLESRRRADLGQLSARPRRQGRENGAVPPRPRPARVPRRRRSDAARIAVRK